RQSLPRREPDDRRRSAARRRELQPCLGLGVHQSRPGPHPAQGTACIRVRRPKPAELRVNITVRIWRQAGPEDPGKLVSYRVDDVSPDMSFLEMLDVLNEGLILAGEQPVAFDHDCREGICGMCGFMINGAAHGPQRGTTVCQLHMRYFKDGDELYLEPWRAKAFPVQRDLIVNRSAFDRIVAAGGFVS